MTKCQDFEPFWNYVLMLFCNHVLTSSITFFLFLRKTTGSIFLTFLDVFVDVYLSRGKDEPGSTYGDVSGFPNANVNGYVGNVSSLVNQPLPKEESVSFSAASDPSRVLDPRLEVSKRSMGSISALKELVRFLIN